MSYITVNRKDKAITKMELRHRLFALKFSEIFKSYMVPSKNFISTNKQIFNISNKVTSIVLIDAFIV